MFIIVSGGVDNADGTDVVMAMLVLLGSALIYDGILSLFVCCCGCCRCGCC